MERGIRGAVLAACCFGLMLSCSSTEKPPEKSAEAPEKAVELFYRQLNEGDYAGAMTLYNSEALQAIEDPQGADDAGFAAWAESETHGGRVQQVKITRTDVGPTSATVEYEVVYSDGASKHSKVALTLEDGQWKLGLIG